MNDTRKLLVLAVLAGTALSGSAQMPMPNAPYSICRTPQLVCRMPPAPPGTTCFCPTPYGMLQGTVQ